MQILFKPKFTTGLITVTAVCLVVPTIWAMISWSGQVLWQKEVWGTKKCIADSSSLQTAHDGQLQTMQTANYKKALRYYTRCWISEDTPKSRAELKVSLYCLSECWISIELEILQQQALLNLWFNMVISLLLCLKMLILLSEKLQFDCSISEVLEFRLIQSMIALDFCNKA